MRQIIDNKAQGRKNRAAGAAFERKVRMMLSSEGYTVSKWNNNIDLEFPQMHACRWNRFNAAGGGFPDFVAMKRGFGRAQGKSGAYGLYKTIWVEAKKNGLLKPEEKAKMQYMEDRGMECWIAYDDEGKVAYRKFVDYITTGRVRGKEVRHQIG
ncbi:hypothetical protein KAI30_04945 [Candidatus Bathyarchaeota archaeon]|nr:hypothetical protein [Candidatus Bathyarchaeota archaeon]